MKFLPAQIAYLTAQPQMRRNLRALLEYLLFVVGVIIAYSVLFHLIMIGEGQAHSWVTGFYWTLTVMSTLGFGDITFQSDLGRLYSMLVLLSGIILLLIVLPFAFIRFFYAPWLEAQVRLRAPQSVPSSVSSHVLVCRFDAIAPGLIERLRRRNIPCYMFERDPVRAAQWHGNDLPILSGDPEDAAAWRRAGIERARLVLANAEDTTNTNIALTVRSVAPKIPVAAIASNQESIDILELSGATRVLPLKLQLGEHMANRVNAGNARLHLLGSFRDLMVAEFSAHRTPLVGRSIRQTRLRQISGLNIVGVWDKGQLLPVHPDLVLADTSVPVVVGTQSQIDAFNELLVIYDVNPHPVVVVGGGKVGSSAARALRAQQIPVSLVEREPALASVIRGVAEHIAVGDAADREVLMRAGLMQAPSVLLTTGDDAMNIYLAIYCRRLNPDLRIISRITDQKNLDAIHRAGADLVLSYATIGVESVLAMLQGHDLVMLGEGVGLYEIPIPVCLQGRSLAQEEVGARTGLNVIAIQDRNRTLTHPPPDMPLPAGGSIMATGTEENLETFRLRFGASPVAM